jgi:site-specific recombinase XerD
VPDSVSLTVDLAGKRWLGQAEADGLERSTIEPYRDHLEQHIIPFIGGKKLTQLTPPGVYDYIDKMKAAGRSEETIRRVVQTLGRIFKFAKGRGLAGHNPVSDVQLRSTKRGKKRLRCSSSRDLTLSGSRP